MAIGSNDKEKCFDRITLKYQCATILIASCPQQDSVEMKAEDIHNRMVRTITNVGIVQEICACGFP